MTEKHLSNPQQNYLRPTAFNPIVSGMNAYQQLEKSFDRMSALDHAAAILDWDESVMMPTQSGSARASAQSELKVMKHEILTNPQLLDLLHQAEATSSSQSPWEQANLREIKRTILRAHAVEKDLVEAYSLASSECQQAWRVLRSENNWKDFFPLFDKLVNLAKHEASQRAQTMKMSEYDCLLEQFSPGIDSQTISSLFDQVKLFLPPLIQDIIEHQRSINLSVSLPSVTIEAQKELGLALMSSLGFDFSRGRLDTSHHPFCGGVSQDVRITTRYSNSNFIGSLMGVLHETGHALYEQNLPEKWVRQPVGMARGMDIHESQSLFFENFIGRNKQFFQFLFPMIKNHLFKNTDSSSNLEQTIFHRLNQVKKSFIRVDADEATYPMHIILRYEIERDLITNKLSAKDLPEIWDAKMQSYLGLSTKNDFKNGCMQDVHWPSGAFGYFPSYSLGSMFAAQIFFTLKKDLPHFYDHLHQGNLTAVKDWLKNKIWSKGSLMNSPEIILSATNEPLNPLHFKNYLQEKYLK